MIPTDTVSQDAGLEVRQFGTGLAPAPLELGGLRNELVKSTHKTQQESWENLCGGGGEGQEAAAGWVGRVPCTVATHNVSQPQHGVVVIVHRAVEESSSTCRINHHMCGWSGRGWSRHGWSGRGAHLGNTSLPGMESTGRERTKSGMSSDFAMAATFRGGRLSESWRAVDTHRHANILQCHMMSHDITQAL